MKVIVRPRQMGKTTELLKYAQMHDLVIVTHTFQAARDLEHRAKQEGYTIRPPICASSLKSDMKCNDVNGIVIDNVELVLNSLMGGISPIRGITVSGVPEEDYNERRDSIQYEDFKRYNPDLTWQDFCAFKYGIDLEEE